MREANPGPLQAGWFKAGLLQRVLSEAQTCQGTQKILNRFDYWLLFNQSVLTSLHFSNGKTGYAGQHPALQIFHCPRHLRILEGSSRIFGWQTGPNNRR
jgi:hypothetical protein